MLFSSSHMGDSFSLGSTELNTKGSFKVVFQDLMTHPSATQVKFNQA